MTISRAIEKLKIMHLEHVKTQNDIYFGFSGGVDSSVLGVLMYRAGLPVKGFHAVCWDEGDYCTAQEDLKDALSVASANGIPLKVLDLKRAYSQNVILPMIESYKKGYVPNIDMSCNQEIKFGVIKQALGLKSGEWLSTGHYALVDELPFSISGEQSNIRTLVIPKDVEKDQTYFLAHIIRDSRIMSQIFFPGGAFTKDEIRDLAIDLKLPNAKKPDSQGICFIGNINMKDFLSRYIKENKGNIVDTAGNIRGTHSGVAFYTIGQRHGFNINNYSPEPLYIVMKDPSKNLLIVGSREEASFKVVNVSDFFTVLNLKRFNQLVTEGLVKCRFRNLGRLVVVKSLEKIDGKKLKLTLDEFEFGLTPGQGAVFYVDGYLIGYATLDY